MPLDLFDDASSSKVGTHDAVDADVSSESEFGDKNDDFFHDMRIDAADGSVYVSSQLLSLRSGVFRQIILEEMRSSCSLTGTLSDMLDCTAGGERKRSSSHALVVPVPEYRVKTIQVVKVSDMQASKTTHV